LNALLAGVPRAELLRFHWVAPPAPWARRIGLGLGAALDEATAAADIVHGHGVWDALIRAACRSAQRRGVTYVITPHGMLDPWSLSQRALKKRLAMAFGYRRLLDRAAFLHALNRDEADLMVPLGLRAPVEVIPNGVFIEEIEPLPPAGSFRARHPQLGDAPYVLFLARLHYKKGLDYLADAFRLLASRDGQVRLVVAGPDGGAGDDFRRRVASMGEGVGGRVHVVGPLYGPDKYAAMADAACFCLPSRQEGFSIATLEALACGVPAVVSDACHFPEVEQAGAGRVVPLEPEAIASAIAEVIAAGPAMQERARSLVRSHYLWGNIAVATLDRYTRSPVAAAVRPPSQAPVPGGNAAAR
jgi:glycosyltransferase involved in cell wall biosynthesis